MKGRNGVRVMTFNIHGGRPMSGPVDLHAIAGVIREIGPDLAGIQELHKWMPPPYVFQDQPKRLKRLLDMEVYFHRSFGLGPVGFGNAFLSWRRMDRVRRVFMLGSGGLATIEPRTYLEGRFQVGGRSIRVVNTHLGLSHPQRVRQVRKIAARLRAYTEPVVLLGDLNATPDSRELELLRDAGLSEAGGLDLLTFPCENPSCRLDYILVSKHFEVSSCFTVDTKVSDHRPMVADLVLH